MPGWLKVLLIVGALLVAGLIVAATFAFRAVSSQMSATAKSEGDGAAYGTGKQPADCIEEALRRAERTFAGQLRTRLFTFSCLKASTPPPGWCDSVPDGLEGVTKWANAQCTRRNLAGDQACSAVYGSVVQYCHSPH